MHNLINYISYPVIVCTVLLHIDGLIKTICKCIIMILRNSRLNCFKYYLSRHNTTLNIGVNIHFITCHIFASIRLFLFLYFYTIQDYTLISFSLKTYLITTFLH